ncbi:MAG: DUF2157 domain-containing protein [Alphaproteobacteria bacterium]
MNKNIINELDDLLADKIIDAPTKDRIENYFAQKALENPYTLLQRIMMLIGVVLIGLGIILLIGYNWYEIPPKMKLILSLMPVIISYGVLALLLWRYPKKEGLIQGFLVLAFLSTGASMSLLGQIYQVQSSMVDFARSWLLPTLPLLIVVPRFIIVFLYAILAVIYYLFGLADINFHIGYFHQLNSKILFFIIPFIYYFYRLWQGNGYREIIALNWLLPIFSVPAWWAICSAILIKDDALIPIAMAILPNLWLSIGYINLIFLKDYNGTNGFILLAGFCFLVGLFIFSSVATYLLIQYPPIATRPLIILTLLNLINLWLSYSKVKIHFGGIQVASLALSLLLFLLVINQFGFIFYLANLTLIYLGVYYLITGTKLHLIWRTNVGLIILCILIALRFFQSELSFAFKGMAFIIIGILFLVTNVILFRQKRKGQQHA